MPQDVLRQVEAEIDRYFLVSAPDHEGSPAHSSPSVGNSNAGSYTQLLDNVRELVAEAIENKGTVWHLSPLVEKHTLTLYRTIG